VVASGIVRISRRLASKGIVGSVASPLTVTGDEVPCGHLLSGVRSRAGPRSR
jgi:hypothetical protein